MMSEYTNFTQWADNKEPKHISFPIHGSSVVTCLLLSGGRIITGSDDHSMYVYSAATGKLIYSLQGHDGGIWSLDAFEDTVVSGSTDGTIRIWDLSTGKCTHVFGGHTSTVRCLSIVKPEVMKMERDDVIVEETWPKQPLIVTGSRDCSLRVWTLPRPGDSEFNCLAFEGSENKDKDHDAEKNPFHLFHLQGHELAVRALATKGRIAVSGSYDCSLRTWDLIDGTCLRTLAGHTQKVFSVALASDCKTAFSGSMDGTVRMWDLESGQCHRILTGHTSLVGLLGLSPSYLISGAADSTLRVWDPVSGEIRYTFTGHTGAITCLQHDEFKVLSGSDEGLIFWDIRDGTVIRRILHGVSGIWQVAFEGNICVAAVNHTNKTMLHIWNFGDIDEGGWVGEPPVQIMTVRSLFLSDSLPVKTNTGTLLADPKVSTQWIDDQEPKHISFPAHGSSVITCLKITENRIITASDDSCIHVYSPASGALIHSLQGHQGGIWALDIFEDSLVSGSTDRTVRVWDLASGRCGHVFGGHTSTVRCLSIVKPEVVDIKLEGVFVKEKWPKRPLIVSGSRDNSLKVWTLPLPGEDEFSCFGSEETEISQKENKDIDAGNNPFHVFHLEGHEGAVRALAAEGRMAVSGSYDCTLRVWDIIDGTCTWVLTGHSQKVYSVILDTDRQKAYSGSMDATVRIWDLKSGQCRHILRGHTSLVGVLGLSPSYLVSAAADSNLRVWDPESGELRHVLAGHTGAITCFQHDEVKVLSGGDGKLALWNIKDGTVIRELLTGITGVWQVVFKGKRCVAASNRNDITMLDIWDFGDGDEIDQLPDGASENKDEDQVEA